MTCVIEIINNTGQLVKVITTIDRTVNFDEFSAGVYIVRFTNTAKETTVLHVVKQ